MISDQNQLADQGSKVLPESRCQIYSPFFAIKYFNGKASGIGVYDPMPCRLSFSGRTISELVAVAAYRLVAARTAERRHR